MSHLTQCLRDERGQAMTEYILIIALVAIASIGAYSAYGRLVASKLREAADILARAR